MASVSTDSNGNRTLQFVAKDRKRRSVRLGKMPLAFAREIKRKVEALNYAVISGQSVDGETARWIAERDQALLAKLAKVGLIARPEDVGDLSLNDFIDAYLAERVDLKPSTVEQLRQVQNNLRKFIGEKMTLREFTPGHADAFKASLASKLADNSVRRNLGRCRQFFEAALRKRLIDKNPFGHLKGITVKGNAERFQFVTHEEIQRVIEAAPDAQWRLIIALARYGGLRTPSETLALKWSDIDWERQRIRVPSPKTAHVGKSFREIPLFPELEPYLRDAFELAAEGTECVITRYSDATQNLRTTMLKIIRRAGLEPWQRVFHNLRASRQTELAKTFPLHVVVAWLGNTEAVAGEHYLHTTADDFERALTNPCSALQKAVQYPTENRRNPQNAVSETTKNPAKYAGLPADTERHTEQIYPTRTRTWNSRTKTCCVANYTIGYRSERRKSSQRSTRVKGHIAK